MNYTQNEKILQVKEENVIVGIDVGSEKQYARAFDWRGMEYSKRAYEFTNNAEGFAGFFEQLKGIMEKSGKESVISRMKPMLEDYEKLQERLEKIIHF